MGLLGSIFQGIVDYGKETSEYKDKYSSCSPEELGRKYDRASSFAEKSAIATLLKQHNQ